MDLIKWFKAQWAWYNKKVMVQSVPSGELDDRSFIQYWEENIHYSFDLSDYLCPATGLLCKREDLDGAHVKIVGDKENVIYITAVHKSFNRSRSVLPFLVKRRFLVKAPKQKAITPKKQ